MQNKNLYMVLDVETANSTEEALVYDVGFLICDKRGNIYDTASMIVYDIWAERELMDSAYYAHKIPEYIKLLNERRIEHVNLYTARKRICDAIEKYKVVAVCAYNAAFDSRALNMTERWVTKSKYRWFLPYGTKIYCIWHMACQVICTQKRYYDFCLKHGFVSPKGNISTSAETVYAYITKDEYFEEAHTGLQDCEIECQIMAHCFRQKKKMDKGINRFCWRIPQRKK